MRVRTGRFRSYTGVRPVVKIQPQWYQAVDLEERRDVIEYPIVDDIDLNGWDVRKALRLFWKSNPAFIEWIQSPITYVDEGLFRGAALALLPEIYSPVKGIHHYRSTARKTYKVHFQEPMVLLKKYFYVLRPLLAARWIAHTGGTAPIEFQRLLAMLHQEPAVLSEVRLLLEQKKSAPEMGLAPAVPSLNVFIETELAGDPVDVSQESRAAQVIDHLNQLFHRVLGE